MYSVQDNPKRIGFPHSEMFGSKFVCQLPEPYRRLLRLSSPSTAKASTVCTYSLDHITQVTKILVVRLIQEPLQFQTKQTIDLSKMYVYQLLCKTRIRQLQQTQPKQANSYIAVSSHYLRMQYL